ncbi:MAG: hypothetical protein KY429_03685 [Actinobacteria bacterium]|nr:hypothetical protein [Actinomycetota bacterium]
MASALVLILLTVFFVIMVTRIVNPRAQTIPIFTRLGRGARAIRRSISRSSTAHRREPRHQRPRHQRPRHQRPRQERPRQEGPRLPAGPVAKFTASWRLLLTIVLLAVGAAMAVLLAIRSILGLLEGMVS